ncbi:MAG: HNH endonuclease signature motif containing protein [Acidimicrobiales bacterium]
MRGALMEADEPIDTAWGGAGLLRAIASEIGLLDLSGLDPGGLTEIVAAGRRVERSVAGLLVRAAQRADELAADGVGPGAEGTLGGNGEVSASTVRSETARAGAAAALPSFAAALSAGSIGAAHLDAAARALNQATDAERAKLVGQGDALLDAARRLSVDSFSRHLSRALQRARDRAGTSREPAPSEVRLWQGRNGVGRLAASFSAEDYERVSSRVAAEMAALCRESDSSSEVGDGVAAPVALDERLAARALLSLISGGGVSAMGRPSITLVVEAATLLDGPHPGSVCETGAGVPVPVGTARRYACDAVIRKVVLDERRVPVEVGRRFRTATDAQWAALRAMYTGCAWFGCDRPLSWCQAHHVVPWSPPSNGPTDLANLVPLCSRHHHLAHEGGWRLVLDADRGLHLHQPDGALWRTARPNRFTADGRGPLTADTPAADRTTAAGCPPPADNRWTAA